MKLPGSQFGPAEHSPGFLYWKVFNAWSRRLRRELETLDLTQVQYSILASLSYLRSAQEHVSQQDIADALSMDKMMVSDVTKTLERKKLLSRSPHPADGRAFSLALTPAARDLLGKAVPLVETTDAAFFAILPEGDLLAFKKSLERLARGSGL